MAFTLTELAILDGLAQGKTLSAIAAGLFLGQPGVSKALRTAEQRSGVHLVEHEGYRVRLTPAGAEVARKSRDVLDRMQDLEQFVERLQSGAAGTIRLVASSTPGNSIVPDVIGEFGRLYPDAEIELRIAHRSEIWDTCAREGFDLGFGPVMGGLGGLRNAGWTVETLYQDRITFFVPPEHPLAGRPVSPPELGADRLVGPFAEPYWSDAWQELERLGFPTTRRTTLLGTEAVKRLVRSGGGIGMLLGLSILQEASEGSLLPLRLDIQPPAVSYALALRPDMRPLPILSTFQEFFRQRVSAVQGQLASMVQSC